LVFVLISFSIVLNISRYPMVWEMVRTKGNPAQSEETETSETTTQTDETQLAEADTSEEQTDSFERHSPTATDVDDYNYDYEQEPSDMAGPIEDIADDGYLPAGSRRLDDADESSDSSSDRDDSLVSLDDDAMAEVLRLPPIDPDAPTPADAHVSRGADGPIPFYPTTGI